MTTSQKIASDVSALLRARNPLLWIVSGEEARVERYIVEAAGAAGYETRFWDVGQGVTDAGGKVQSDGGKSPDQVLDVIAEKAQTNIDSRNGGKRTVWILRDMPVWFQNGQIGASVLRQVRNLTRSLPAAKREYAQAMVIISPDGNVPPELRNSATVIEWPLPDREEVGAILDATIASLPDEIRDSAAPNGTRDAAIDAAVGLSGEEIQACYAKSLVQLRRIDPKAVAQEKRRVIARERVLEWFEPLAGGLDAVGGLENLKAWLVSRAMAYTKEAREYGLPAPKGALLVGCPGCGKSLTAKAIATAWGVPLLRLDLGALKSKFVGDSEAQIRKAFSVIEAIGRCVVWVDEIEKAMQGATSGSADGGVSADALQVVLTWMQERKGESFVIATANDAESLPPELMRKGRFDDVWFVDLPTVEERASILRATIRLRCKNVEDVGVDIYRIAKSCDQFTGSEVAELVPDAMYRAFSEGARPIETGDLLAAVLSTVPLVKTAPAKIERLRDWAKGRARLASAAEAVPRPSARKAANSTSKNEEESNYGT